MRIAFVSDIHGNLPALKAVEDDIDRAGVDAILNLGDLLAGPLWVADTCKHLMAGGWPTIAGNHERQMLDPDLAERTASDRFAAARLDDDGRRWMATLPGTLRWHDEVLLVHGTPTNDLAPLLETVDAGRMRLCGTAASPQEVARRLGDALADQRHGLIACGHSHLPRLMRLDDGRLVINPGSVGLQAFDDDHPIPYLVENNSPHARYAIAERRPSGWQVEFRAVAYAHDEAAALASANGRPDWADALRTGRVGRTESSAVAP
jgi:predicted phosphodiesterase